MDGEKEGTVSQDMITDTEQGAASLLGQLAFVGATNSFVSWRAVAEMPVVDFTCPCTFSVSEEGT